MVSLQQVLSQFYIGTPAQQISVFSLLKFHVSGLVQDCGMSSANALDIPQSCTNPVM